jgi:hypothetical protein
VAARVGRHLRILIPPCGGSNPPTPARQCSLSYSISGGAGTADIPAGYAGAPESLAGKFRTFGSGLAALRRQSLLTIFQFPFRHTRDRFDSEGETGLRSWSRRGRQDLRDELLPSYLAGRLMPMPSYANNAIATAGASVSFTIEGRNGVPTSNSKQMARSVRRRTRPVRYGTETAFGKDAHEIDAAAGDDEGLEAVCAYIG